MAPFRWSIGQDCPPDANSRRTSSPMACPMLKINPGVNLGLDATLWSVVPRIPSVPNRVCIYAASLELRFDFMPHVGLFCDSRSNNCKISTGSARAMHCCRRSGAMVERRTAGAYKLCTCFRCFRSAFTIIWIKSSNETSASQPKSSLALVGSLTSRSTSAGL